MYRSIRLLILFILCSLPFVNAQLESDVLALQALAEQAPTAPCLDFIQRVIDCQDWPGKACICSDDTQTLYRACAETSQRIAGGQARTSLPVCATPMSGLDPPLKRTLVNAAVSSRPTWTIGVTVAVAMVYTCII